MHRHLAVLGSPIAHSRSPHIHRAAYQVLELPWQYEAIECDEQGLQPLLESRGDEWLGFSVTMPLKVQAYNLSAVLDPVASESGVVNTLLRLIDRDGVPSWAGFNTDVSGLAAALDEADLDTAHTIVLGSGATAVSAVLAARMRGATRISVVARRLEPARALVHRFLGGEQGSVRGEAYALSDAPFEAWEHATAVISTVPGVAAGDLSLPPSLTKVELFDVAYDPWPSPLAEFWRTHGGLAHSGLGMLLHQAIMQVRIFVHGDPNLALAHEDDMLEAMRMAASAR